MNIETLKFIFSKIKLAESQIYLSHDEVKALQEAIVFVEGNPFILALIKKFIIKEA